MAAFRMACHAACCVLIMTAAAGCSEHVPGDGTEAGGPALVASAEYEALELAPGYRIEKVADTLTYLTGITFDDEGTVYVLEAGGAYMEAPPPARIIRLEDGGVVEAVDLEGKGVAAPVVGLAWHDGAFYISHRDPETMMGAVSRVSPAGVVTRVLSGVRDAQSAHFLNELRVGPDGMLYLGSGQATNAGVVGPDLSPFIEQNSDLRPVPCQDLVLTGMNYVTPDFRSDDPADSAVTGAFVPFGTATEPGRRIEGDPRTCGGSILRFDPRDAEGTVRAFAWGFRQPIGFAWDSRNAMFVTVNGTNVEGSRPIADEYDPTYRVREGQWYGHPDFSAALIQLDDARFSAPAAERARRLRGAAAVPDSLPPRLLIDHAASGLTAPDTSLVAALHDVNSSPSGIDVAPAVFGFGDHLFVAEWGDYGSLTSPGREAPAGSQIVRIDPETREVVPFVRNRAGGPASGAGAAGQGMERPFNLRFAPDGSLYIVDYGVVRFDPANEESPVQFPPRTGAVWRVTRAH
ncbi:MAG: sugar dehydrogenase [Gemmatimonadota bacterium]